MALNHIAIMGRLTKDPEMRYTNSNKPVVSFTLAVDRDFGEKQTDFIPCVAWDKTAEFVNKYFCKGKQAIVAGRLQMRDWQDKDGYKRTVAEVVAANVYFAESKKAEQTPARDVHELERFPVTKFASMDDDDEDLPF